VFEIGQIDPTIHAPSFRPRLRPPKAVIRKAVEKIAKGYFGTILRGDAREPIGAFMSADAAANADQRRKGNERGSRARPW
jgi:hypothetical protein